jgi:ribosomal protein S18 acetylase RimI-like enzyme
VHEVRVATVDDIAAIAEFQTGAWNDSYRDLVPAEYLARMTVQTRTERWGGRIRSGDRQILLMQTDGQIEVVASVGARSDDRPGPRLELMSLYVDPQLRGPGLGQRMLDLVVGDRAAVLWVFRDNVRAIDFYRRHGFEIDGHGLTDDDTQRQLARMTRGWGGR